MQIGFITGEYPPMEGGVGAFTQRLAEAMAALGHDIHIITCREARPERASRRIAQLNEPVDLGFAWLHPRIGRWRWPSLATIADITLRQELEVVNIQYQAAAFNMRSPAINLLPWRLKGLAKTAVTFHDLRTPYLFPKAGRLRQAAVTIMARQANGVIVTNQADYQQLAATLPSPIVKIPIGSNIKTHPQDEAGAGAVRRRLGLAANACLLGYFGFLNESKGAGALISTLSQLPDRFHLIFIGGQTGASDAENNQAYLDGLKSQITAAGLDGRVHWTGFVEEKEVSAYLHAADLMVMPYRDGASLRRGTLMAVLAHGRPLITTNPAIPTPELVHKQNVYFIPANLPNTLPEAVLACESDKGLRTRLGKAAAKTASQFSWQEIGERTAVFFQRLRSG